MNIETGVIHPERFDAAGRTPDEDRNVALVKQAFEAFARTDFDFLYTKTIPDAEVGVAWLTPEKLGEHAENLDFVPQTFNQGMRFEIYTVVAEGDTVCVQWHDTARTSSGKIYENDGLSVFKFADDGRVRSYLEYIDLDKLVAAL